MSGKLRDASGQSQMWTRSRNGARKVPSYAVGKRLTLGGAVLIETIVQTHTNDIPLVLNIEKERVAST
jgi:hypothetical protein